MIITKLIRTCDACPSQWEGETIDGKAVYIRFRWGCLRISFANTIGKAILGVGELTLNFNSKDCWAGFMPYEELKTLFTERIKWPENES